MRPTKLLVFGNPKAGTPLMLAAPSSAIDLPLKILVWEDGESKVWISYNSPQYPAEAARHSAGADAQHSRRRNVGSQGRGVTTALDRRGANAAGAQSGPECIREVLEILRWLMAAICARILASASAITSGEFAGRAETQIAGNANPIMAVVRQFIFRQIPFAGF